MKFPYSQLGHIVLPKTLGGKLLCNSVQQAQVNAYKKLGADVNKDENDMLPSFKEFKYERR